MEQKMSSMPTALLIVMGSAKQSMPTAAATKGSIVAKMEACPGSTCYKPLVYKR